MKRRFTFIVATVACLATQAQTAKVVDLTTLKPMAGVAYSSPNSDSKLFTDNDGRADLSRFDLDSLLFTFPGYQPLHTTISGIMAAGGQVGMVEQSYALDEVVLSASKFEEKRKDVAQQIQVLNSKEIAFGSQGSMAEVMQNTGNVMVQKSQLGGGSPIIRGFEANKVLMVVDGVRMNNAIYRGGHLQNILTMDNAIMDKVEIVFGPGSVMYGSDALGGVMHFFTKNPLLSDTAGLRVKSQAFLRYASAAREKTGHLDLSLGTKRFGSLTSITFTDFDDLRQGSVRSPFNPGFGNRSFYVQDFDGLDSMVVNPDTNLQVGSGYTQYDILQKFLFQQNANISHVLNLQFSNSGDVPRYDRLSTLGGNGLPTHAVWYYGPQQRVFGSYTLNLNLDKGFANRARVIVAYQNIEESRHDRRFRSVNFNHRTETLNILSLNADLSRKIGKQEIRYGLEANYNAVASAAYRENIDTGDRAPLDTRYPDGGSSMRSLAAYLSHAWEISPKLILNDGLRLSNVALESNFIDTSYFPFPFNSIQQNNTALNGNIGLICMPGKDWRFTLSGSSGFRAPNVDDISKVFESTPGTVVVPNPGLKPEHTYNVDLGISKTIAKTATFGITAFYTSYQNVITTGLGSFNGQDSILFDGQMSEVRSLFNGSKAYLTGFNAYGSIDLGANFSLASTLNYTYARLRTDTSDYPLDHIPPMYGRTTLTWKVRKLRTELFAAYSAWKRLKDYNMLGEDNFPFATPVGMPSWITLNFRGAYQVNPKLQVQVSVENILDQNYRVFASNISAPGRNFILTLRATL